MSGRDGLGFEQRGWPAWRARRPCGGKGGRMKRAFAAFVVLGVIAATFFAASPAYATYPGHNGRIAFQADTGGGNQIYTVRPNGHDLFQVTHVKPAAGVDPGTSGATTPDWSPNGH